MRIDSDFPTSRADESASRTPALTSRKKPAHEMMTSMIQPMSQAEFVQRVNRLRLILLLIWGSITFGVAFFARDLSFNVLDKPFGFWMAAQGSVLIFLAITWIYALLVNHWERQTQSDPETS